MVISGSSVSKIVILLATIAYVVVITGKFFFGFDVTRESLVYMTIIIALLLIGLFR